MTKKSAGPKHVDPKADKEADAEKRRLDEELNEALEDTFPASDPVKLTQPDQHVEPHPKYKSKH